MPTSALKGKSPARIGRYEVLRKIATGGMAELFLAKQTGMEGFEKVVAIKRILSHLAHDEEFINMFRDEARIVAKLSHPNIVQIYDLGKSDDSYFIAMEYIPGRNLSSIAKRAKARGTLLPPVYVARCMAQACEGLYYAHNRKDLDGKELHVVHRDVSPQNIIVGFSGQVKLVDFGIAKAATKIAHTRAGVLKGKYAYMSPEQIRGEAIDARSDLFAVGIVLYELLCGRRPFEKENSIQTLKAIVQDKPTDPREVNPNLPEGMAAIIHKALTKKREDRYQNAQEVQIALEDFVAGTGKRASNLAISQWLNELFAEELSKAKGSTVVFKGIGEVILPEDERAAKKKAAKEDSSRKATPVAPSREKSPAKDEEPVVLKRGRGGGSVEARPPIAAPSTRMPSSPRRDSSVIAPARQAMIEEGVINRSDAKDAAPPSDYTDDATTIAPPTFGQAAPTSAPPPAKPPPDAVTDGLALAAVAPARSRSYEEGVRDGEPSDDDADAYDDGKTEFAAEAAPDPSPAARSASDVARALARPAHADPADADVNAPSVDPLASQAPQRPSTEADLWDNEQTNEQIATADPTTGMSAEEIADRLNQTRSGRPASPGRVRGRRPSPTKSPAPRIETDTESPPSRDDSTALPNDGQADDWQRNDGRTDLEEQALPRPADPNVDVDSDGRTVATADFDMSGIDVDMDVDVEVEVEVEDVPPPSSASGPRNMEALRAANAPTGIDDNDDDDTIGPENPLDAFDAQLSDLGRPTRNRDHLSDEVPRVDPAESAIALPPLRRKLDANSTEQEGPLPPGAPSGASSLLPPTPDSLGLPGNPIAAIGSTKVPPANISLSDMLTSGPANPPPPSSGGFVVQRAQSTSGMPQAAPSMPAATPAPDRIVASRSRSQSVVRATSASRNIKESVRPGPTVGPAGGNGAADLPPIDPLAVGLPNAGGPVMDDMRGGASLLGKIGTPVSGPDMPPMLAPAPQTAPVMFHDPNAQVGPPPPKGGSKKLRIALIALCFVLLAGVVTAVLYKTRRPMLHVSTSPPGARIFMNSRLLPGETPLKVEVRPGSQYLIRVVSEGHEEIVKRVPIPPDNRASKIHFKLKQGTSSPDAVPETEPPEAEPPEAEPEPAPEGE